RSTVLLGVQTNREYLIQILDSAEFREARAHTAFLPAPAGDSASDTARITAAVLYQEETRQTPFPNYRNNPYRDPSIKLRVREKNIEVSWKRLAPHHYSVECGARTPACRVHTRVNAPDKISLTIDGITRTFHLAQSAGQIFVCDTEGSTTIHRLPRHPKPASASQHETANSPMPGQVLRILVKQGQQVKSGDALVVLEAMKMEQTIRTTIHGVVQSILVETGQVVAPGQMLVEISAQEKES
ncbi:MAG TPA: biotin/lipoyl-containing protein, partial [Bryobacteraceae bacterium]|nr:biotin/lipoyl-containing protein [Bryobacteraceae bacterium]